MLRPSIPPMSVGVGEVTHHPGGSLVELDVLTRETMAHVHDGKAILGYRHD